MFSPSHTTILSCTLHLIIQVNVVFQMKQFCASALSAKSLLHFCIFNPCESSSILALSGVDLCGPRKGDSKWAFLINGESHVAYRIHKKYNVKQVMLFCICAMENNKRKTPNAPNNIKTNLLNKFFKSRLSPTTSREENWKSVGTRMSWAGSVSTFQIFPNLQSNCETFCFQN